MHKAVEKKDDCKVKVIRYIELTTSPAWGYAAYTLCGAKWLVRE